MENLQFLPCRRYSQYARSRPSSEVPDISPITLNLFFILLSLRYAYGQAHMHMNVVVDYGNTSAKIGIFEDDVLKERHAFGKTGDVIAFQANFSGGRIIVRTVKSEMTDLTNTL